MTEVSRMEELRTLSMAVKKSADVPPPAVVVRQPPPPVSSLPELRIALGPLDQVALWTEYQMFCRLMCGLASKRQRRAYLPEVKKLLAKWQLLDLRETTAHFFSSFDSLQVPMVAPSRPYAELTLARLRICRAMLALILSAIERAYAAIREVLSQRFFMAFSMLCMAMLSKFYAELIVVDELLSLLTERLAAFLAFAAVSIPSLQLSTLLTELGSLASKAPPHRSTSRPLFPTAGGPRLATPLRATAAAMLDLGEPLNRTPGAEGKRPIDTTTSPAPTNATKKMKSPQPASPVTAVTPTAKAGKPSHVSTPPFVRSVHTTPIGSFWTPSPSAVTPSSKTSSPSLFAVVPVANRSPSLPRPAVSKPKTPPVTAAPKLGGSMASGKKVDDLMALLSGRPAKK